MFFKCFAKNAKSMIQGGSLNRLFPLVNFINCDPLSDHSKSKAQTTKVQQPRPCLLFPLAKINYLAKEKEKKEKKDISFSSLPDGKSASRNNDYHRSFSADDWYRTKHYNCNCSRVHARTSPCPWSSIRVNSTD